MAVVADTWWQARTALDALPIVWDEGENAQGFSSASIAKWLDEGLDNAQPVFRRKPERRRQSSTLQGCREEGRGGLQLPLPESCHDGAAECDRALHRLIKCEVWCGTQNGEAALRRSAGSFRLCRPTSATCYKIMPGGGFGRRGQTDYVRQAVAIAKQMPGTPIKLLWSTRRRHATRQLPPDHALQNDRCAFDADNNLTGTAYEDFRTVDPVQP